MVPTLNAASHGVNTNSLTIPVPASVTVPHGKAIVFELLKVYMENNTPLADILANLSQAWYSQAIELQIASPFPPPTVNTYGLGTQSVVAHDHALFQWDGGATGAIIEDPHVVTVTDLTDGAGHGVIVPSPNFQFVVARDFPGNVTTTQPISCFCRLLFRYKLVDIEEYLQMVTALGLGTF